MRALALVGLAALSTTASAAEPNGMFSFNTGFRPLGLPVAPALGGGARVGVIAGPVTVFGGGSASIASSSEADSLNPATFNPSAYTAQLGGRLRVADLEAAQTFVVLGGMVSNVGFRQVWDPRRDRGSAWRGKAGPGVFAGGGADAFVSKAVSLNVEGGLAYSGWSFKNTWFSGSQDQEDVLEDNGIVFTYGSIGVTVWTGGDR